MRKVLSILSIGLALSACGKKDSSSASGTFPDFSELALKVAPAFTSTSMQLVRNEVAPMSVLPMAFPNTTFSTSASDWTTATSAQSDLLATVLLNAGTSGTVKSMFVVIAQAQSTMTDLNSNYSDSSGNATNCTAIDASKTLTTPFFDSATHGAFNDWDDAGLYTCYTTTGSNGIMAFGRKAIASPSADCTDAYEYSVLYGYGGEDQPLTDSQYGTSSDGYSVSKYHYNGCTKDLKIVYGQSTLYSGGYRFSSRSELSGNTADNSFTMRIAYIDNSDVNSTGHGTLISFLGTGTSKKAADSASAAKFVIGYSQSTACNSDGTGCNAATEKTFCVSNDSTSDSYTQVTSSPASTCDSTLTTPYSALTGLVWDDVPNAYTTANTAAALGL